MKKLKLIASYVRLITCLLLHRNFGNIIMKKSHSKLSKNEPVCMCKEGWCVGLGQEWGPLHKGSLNCLKYLKRVLNRKEGS